MTPWYVSHPIFQETAKTPRRHMEISEQVSRPALPKQGAASSAPTRLWAKCLRAIGTLVGRHPHKSWRLGVLAVSSVFVALPPVFGATHVCTLLWKTPRWLT